MLQLPESTPVINGRQPIINGVYRHFKGDFYRVIAVSKHTETGEYLVTYHSLDDTSKVWTRPLDMFMSPVDTQKYPNADQTNRLEYCPNM